MASSYKKCTQDDAINAESEADLIRNAGSLYESFLRYSQCDDGAIAEGYSYSLVQILTNNWKSEIDKLSELSKKDNYFKLFLIKHVDQLMTQDENKIIINNAKYRCPANALDLCDAIYKAASAR